MADLDRISEELKAIKFMMCDGVSVYKTLEEDMKLSNQKDMEDFFNKRHNYTDAEAAVKSSHLAGKIQGRRWLFDIIEDLTR